MSNLPFITDHFDGLVSSHVVQHAMPAEIKRTFVEIQRVLKKGGLGLIITLALSDHRNGKGRMLEPNTYVFEDSDEPNIVHHFFSRDELSALLGQSSIVSFSEEAAPSDKGERHYFNVIFTKQ